MESGKGSADRSWFGKSPKPDKTSSRTSDMETPNGTGTWLGRDGKSKALADQNKQLEQQNLKQAHEVQRLTKVGCVMPSPVAGQTFLGFLGTTVSQPWKRL